MFCPVCNGLEPLQATCLKCSRAAEDIGRLTDLTGPYAPYEPIESMEETFGRMGTVPGSCLHVAACSGCGQTFEVTVPEWGSNRI